MNCLVNFWIWLNLLLFGSYKGGMIWLFPAAPTGRGFGWFSKTSRHLYDWLELFLHRRSYSDKAWVSFCTPTVTHHSLFPYQAMKEGQIIFCLLCNITLHVCTTSDRQTLSTNTFLTLLCTSHPPQYTSLWLSCLAAKWTGKWCCGWWNVA